jgi:hypothetical protein
LGGNSVRRRTFSQHPGSSLNAHCRWLT